MTILSNKSNSDMILESRYLLRSGDGTLLENKFDLFWRVADAIANCDSDRIMFYSMMMEGEFLPNSPTLVNAGTNKGCMSACFVVTPEDSLDSIMDTLKQAAFIVKSGGGVGIGVNKIRPKGDYIASTHKNALGPVAVLNDYSVVLNSLTQSGSFREAALMGQIHISHPDVQEFIHCKDNLVSLRNFNLSVQVTDEFMRCVSQKKMWNFVHPNSGEVVDSIYAFDLWNEICTAAHKTGDPGVVFIDRVIESHPNPNLGTINSSNPCGEEFLEDFGSCNLGSINLSKFITKFECEYDWNWQKLGTIVRASVRFLNGVIDTNVFPLKELRDMNLLTRRIGLGIMGLADALVALQIPYDSEDALDMSDKVGRFILREAWQESKRLASKNGPFPNFYSSDYFTNSSEPVYNSSVITIAPTGTISRIAECSSGIEPYFALVWNSNVLWNGDKYVEMLDCPKPIMDALENKFSLDFSSINSFLLTLRDADKERKEEMLFDIGLEIDLFPVANEIDPLQHVRMLATFQKNTTNSVSKTINLPNDATVENVDAIYFLAWDLYCKGVTIYRERSREVEVLSVNNVKKTIPILEEGLPGKPLSSNCNVDSIDDEGVYNRPIEMGGKTYKVATGHGSMYITVNKDDWGNVKEVFGNIGKSGGCFNAALESTSRLISLFLQNGMKKNEIIKQLRGITCCPCWHEKRLIQSPYDAIAMVLENEDGGVELYKELDKTDYIENSNMMESKPTDLNVGQFILKCKFCSGQLINQSNCLYCLNCGYSKCS